MLVSMNWIQEFVNLEGLNINNLIQRFTLSTAEVEDIIYKGNKIKNVVVGKIMSITEHPDSKKLHLLKIDTGNRIYDCVCGAPNIYEGMIVPFAQEGGSIDSMEIVKTTIAGCVSEGMCCSEAELGINNNHSGIMEIDGDVTLGTDIKTIYALDDIIFEIDNKSLTNRPDLWGHYGIAREFSALTGRKLKKLAVMDVSSYSILPPVDIQVYNQREVYRYTGIKVSNIKVKHSPVNMKIRLAYCGARTINLLADLTNYIMMEIGQPMHAFDLRKVNSIEVKNFDENLNFLTLDNVERKINKNNLMISSYNKPIAIAGIMGGYDTEITDDTDSLLLESANFDGTSVRKTSNQLGLRTDASVRYEKALDPEMTSLAIERYLKILFDIDSGAEVISSMTDKYVKKYEKLHLEFDKEYVDRYTGIHISAIEIESTLKSLGFIVKTENNKFSVDVPSFRATKDIMIPADLIEEITRIYGYDNFAISSTHSKLYPAVLSDNKKMEYSTKDLLINKFNLNEVASYIWTNSVKMKELGIEIEKNVRLVNSLISEQGVLRNSMIPSLLTILFENKTFNQKFGIFEIGKIVDGLLDNGLCNERKKLGIALFDRMEDEKTLFLLLKDIINTIGMKNKNKRFTFMHNDVARHHWQNKINYVSISVDGTDIGYMCTLHPVNKSKIDKKASIVVAELDMDILADIPVDNIVCNEASKFPNIEIDLCFIMNEKSIFSDLENVWLDLNFAYLYNYKVIDIYNSDVNSITVRFYFSSLERTLTHDEIQPFIEKLIQNLKIIGISMKE